MAVNLTGQLVEVFKFESSGIPALLTEALEVFEKRRDELDHNYMAFYVDRDGTRSIVFRRNHEDV